MLTYVVQVSTECYITGQKNLLRQSPCYRLTVSNIVRTRVHMCVCVCMCAHVKHLPDWCTGYENSRIRLSNPYSYHSTCFLFVNWKTSLHLLQSLHLLLILTIKGHSSNLLGRFHHNPPPIRMVGNLWAALTHLMCLAGLPTCLTQLQKPDGQVPCVTQCDVFNMLSSTTGDKFD